MEVLNEMTVEFRSKSSNEAFARATVAAFAAQLDPTIDEMADLKTAVSEAVTNAIIHGYSNTDGVVRVKCTLFRSKICVEVTDQGHGIENVTLARQPLYTSRPELERSGMGFTVMETFMDSVEVVSSPGNGTLVRMVKTFDSLSSKGSMEG